MWAGQHKESNIIHLVVLKPYFSSCFRLYSIGDLSSDSHKRILRYFRDSENQAVLFCSQIAFLGSGSRYTMPSSTIGILSSVYVWVRILDVLKMGLCSLILKLPINYSVFSLIRLFHDFPSQRGGESAIYLGWLSLCSK